MKSPIWLICSLAAAGSAYLVIRRLGRRWGATDEEARSPLPGDDVIAAPTWRTTHGITINAPAREIWPWLVQAGVGRGGWYTSEWFDRLVWGIDNPSVDRIVPELQQLRVGDLVPDSVDGTAHFHVAAIEPERALVLHSIRHPINGRWPDLSAADPGPYLDFSWAFVLREQRDGTTRLLLRARCRMQPRWLMVMVPLADLMDFLSPWQMLRGIKRRVERTMTTGQSLESGRGQSRVGAASDASPRIPVGSS